MKVRKNDGRSSEELRTSRQWGRAGFIVNQGEQGEEMWVNRYCQDSARYFDKSQVHAGTEEELKEFFRPERERRNEKERLRRELKRKKENRKKNIEEAIKKPYSKIGNPSGIVVFDLETTGLDSEEDEILQFSAIDGDGNVLLNTLIKPYLKESWREAQCIHHISPADVANAPQLHEIIPALHGIFDSAELLVSYNGNFDMEFLYFQAGLPLYGFPHYDVMLEFAPIFGEWSSYHGNYKWQKLTTCAKYYGYEFKAHDSLEDVKATLFCYKKMIESEEG